MDKENFDQKDGLSQKMHFVSVNMDLDFKAMQVKESAWVEQGANPLLPAPTSEVQGFQQEFHFQEKCLQTQMVLKGERNESRKERGKPSQKAENEVVKCSQMQEKQTGSKDEENETSVQEVQHHF